jgi:hypothetical protein
MGGGENFGFVASGPELDILELSRFVDADEKVRDVKPQPEDTVLGKIEMVIAGIVGHSAVPENASAGAQIVSLFQKAMWRALKENGDKDGKDGGPPGEIKIEDFLVALKDNKVNRQEAARQIRDAAIQAYTMGAGLERRTVGHLYTDMNRALRKITRLTSLTDAAVRGAM